MPRWMLFALAAFVVSLTTWTIALAGGGSASVVKIKTTVDSGANGKSVVVFTLNIKPGWHLYANPINNAKLDGNEVVIKSLDGDAKITYPPGLLHEDKDFGKYGVYKNEVTIRATLDRVVDAANPARFTIKLSSCDKDNCLPSSTVKVTAP